MIFSTPSLEAATASPEYLLAMKLLASRVGQGRGTISERSTDSAVSIHRTRGSS